MNSDTIFERIFGHCAHQGSKIQTAIHTLLAGAGGKSAEQHAAAGLATMQIPTFAAELEAVPACSELMRRYAVQGPAGSLRDTQQEFLRLGDLQQQAIIAVVFQALVHWRAYLRVRGAPRDCAEAAGADSAHRIGAHAYEALLGFDCLMSGCEPSQAEAKVDGFIDEVLPHMVTAQANNTTSAPQPGTIANPPASAPAGTGLAGLSEAASEYDRLAGSGQRYVVLDLAAGLQSAERNAMGETLEGWTATLAAAPTTERFRLLHRAVIATAAALHGWRAPDCRGRPISMAAPADPIWRRSTRVLAMVHELHKAGYQRLRIRPFLSGSGCYWRCWITPSSNMRPDGYNLIDEDHDDANPGLVARYTSGQDNEFFGWADAKSMTARQLAITFTERFPRIVAQSQGCDWAYAGWLTDVLGHAELGLEQGGLVNLDNYDGPMDPGYLARWQPPPPSR